MCKTICDWKIFWPEKSILQSKNNVWIQLSNHLQDLEKSYFPGYAALQHVSTISRLRLYARVIVIHIKSTYVVIACTPQVAAIQTFAGVSHTWTCISTYREGPRLGGTRWSESIIYVTVVRESGATTNGSRHVVRCEKSQRSQNTMRTRK